MGWMIVGVLFLSAVELPVGSAPEPLVARHFPSRLHEFVWRNWQLVPIDRMAKIVDASPAQILAMGKRMGLVDPPPVSDDQWRRSHITIIRRNWHLLPYEQLLELLDWDAEHMAFILREDDFLYIKLGNLKPDCLPLRYIEPDAALAARESAMADTLREAFPSGVVTMEEPLFAFVQDLSELPTDIPASTEENRFAPRFCYSYFALYGDALLEPEADPYPDGYLARLAQAGVSGVWIQGVLFKLHPFPWDPALSEHYQERLANLRALVARARKHGIGIYMYLNEPRSMPTGFFDAHPDLMGVVEGEYAAMCTSSPPVRDFIRDTVTGICREVPDLAGFFTITASENLTNCWSHHQGAQCPRCTARGAETVIAEVNTLIQEGIEAANAKTGLIAWDWGWQDAWAEGIISQLPRDVALMSVSEWSMPITRGGVDSVIGEYSLSTIGPGPRAGRNWAIAREKGHRTIAKVQAGNTWELSSVPYIPVIANVAQHALNLLEAGIDGVMLGWTLGGYPSPNLDVFVRMGQTNDLTVEDAMRQVATDRFGAELAPAVVTAWKAFSIVFQEHPYCGIYEGPQQVGPANLLWEAPTGYRASMVCFPYDDLNAWRGPYSPEGYAQQYRKMANGFDQAIRDLESAAAGIPSDHHQVALEHEMDVARVCAIHFHSVANQAGFVAARDALSKATDSQEAEPLLLILSDLINDEMRLAADLYAIQARDSRIGYEASNHYFYVPMDLVEKVLNCRDLLDRWLPEQRRRFVQGQGSD